MDRAANGTKLLQDTILKLLCVASGSSCGKRAILWHGTCYSIRTTWQNNNSCSNTNPIHKEASSTVVVTTRELSPVASGGIYFCWACGWAAEC